MTDTERQAAFAKVSAKVMYVIRAAVADLKVEVNPTGPTGLSLYAEGEVRELEALRAFAAKHLTGKIEFLYHYPADEDLGAADTYSIV